MNILLMVNDMVVPNRGGGAPRIDAVAMAFKRKGYNVYIFAPVNVDKDLAEEYMGCKVIPMKYIDRNDPKKIFKYGFYNPFLTLKTFYIIKKYKINLIFAHNVICGFPALISSKFFKVPFVFDPTDIVSEFVKNNIKRNIINKIMFKLIRRIEGFTIKNSTKVISNTIQIKNLIKERYKKDIDIIYDGYNKNIFYPTKGVKNKKFTYILQGGMDKQDGLEILIPAVKNLIKKTTNIQVWMIGDGKVVPNLKEKIKNDNIEKYFWFSGWVSQDKVREYMNKAHIGLVILPNLLSAKIRITLRTFEYWACKLPIIAANLEGVKEVVKDKWNGMLYNVEDPNDLANKMYLLYKDKNLYKKLKINGFETVQNFEWSKLGDNIVSLIENEGLITKSRS